ncbi:MAG: pyroglutamyl-peptidase I [Oscillospiraceae bacterium]|nr:pyroglutamyl-peptidase I [Oscillospiraceae bacterium]
MKKLLITGFDPFGGETVNPSWEAVKQLPETIGDYALFKFEIPTIFGLAAQTVLEKAAQIQPDVILCIGQAGGRDAVTPERIGINVRNARIADNAGNRPQEEIICEDGADGIFATVPVAAMAEAIRKAELPAHVSNTAGAFVCNDTLYTLLYHFAGKPVHVGFIHVPYIPQQGTPNLPLEQITHALTAAISAL